MPGIAKNLERLRSQIPASVKLVAVSKTKPVSDILEAYHAGQKQFGENRVQELLNKKDELPSDIEWHFIGHLQTNKVKFIAPFISMIQSVDTFKLLHTINSEAFNSKRSIDCLLEIHIASEETKSGFSVEELSQGLEKINLEELKNVRICGVMGMATFTDNIQQVQYEFKTLVNNFGSLKTGFFSDTPYFREVSMGMSGDYELAINEGSTMLRIGSRIFGERNK